MSVICTFCDHFFITMPHTTDSWSAPAAETLPRRVLRRRCWAHYASIPDNFREIGISALQHSIRLQLQRGEHGWCRPPSLEDGAVHTILQEVTGSQVGSRRSDRAEHLAYTRACPIVHMSPSDNKRRGNAYVRWWNQRGKASQRGDTAQSREQHVPQAGRERVQL